MVDRFVRCYNDERLHSAISYVTPKDKLEGREAMIFAEGKRKLAEARKRRSLARAETNTLALDERQPITAMSAVPYAV